jgi:hypothetical protein
VQRQPGLFAAAVAPPKKTSDGGRSTTAFRGQICGAAAPTRLSMWSDVTLYPFVLGQVVAS